MGQDRKVEKPRVCLNCKQTLTTDSAGLKEHFIVCCKASRVVGEQPQY